MHYPHRVMREMLLANAIKRAQSKGVSIHTITKRDPRSRVASKRDRPLLREIRRLREDYDLSMADIASLTDCSESFVELVLSGFSKQSATKKTMGQRTKEDFEDRKTIFERAEAERLKTLAEKRKAALRPRFCDNM